MTKENIYEVLMTMVGPIEPTGYSSRDEEILENLTKLEDVISKCLIEIRAVSANRLFTEFSVQKIGLEAHAYLKHLREDLVWLYQNENQ